MGSTVADKYVVESRLASGGMGVIYEARQEPLDREVALKVLSLRHGEVDEDFERRFYLEAATCAKLNHPNIVVIHDYGRLSPAQGGACFMVMELIDGRTITKAVVQDGPFEPLRALRVARDIAQALRTAHRRGVIHRDLKPSNVMLEHTPEGERVKVLDFGLVKVLRDEQEQITQEGEFLGSPKYMAPEQIDHSEVDARADLYSLGVVLYVMLSGHAPFEHREPMRNLLAHVHDEVPPLSTHGVEVTEAISALVMKCLEKNPDDRFQSAEEFIVALAQAYSELTEIDISRSDGWALTTASDEAVRLRAGATRSDEAVHLAASVRPRRSRTRMSAYALLAVAVLALAVVGTLLIERQLQPSPPPSPAPSEPPSLAPDPSPATAAPAEGEPSPVPPEPPVTAFSLLVESSPPGAALTHGEVGLGVTPVAIRLETEPLEDEPMVLTLTLAGHHPFVWTQGPLGRDGRIHAQLIRASQSRRRASPDRARPEPPSRESAPPEVLPWARPNPY